jgi:hypothetical protein
LKKSPSVSIHHARPLFAKQRRPQGLEELRIYLWILGNLEDLEDEIELQVNDKR